MAGPFKLTKEEGLALIGGLEGLVGTAKIAVVLTAVVGPERTARLVVDREAVPLTRAEKIALIDGIVPLIPGVTSRDKVRNVGLAAKPAFATKARFLEAVEYVKARIKRHAAESAASTALPPAGSTVTGYGPVNNHWKLPDPTIRQILARMQAQNVRAYKVESVGHASEDVLGKPDLLAQMKAKTLFSAAECAKRGIIYHVTLFNDNAGKNTWKNQGPSLGDRLPQAKAFIDWFAATVPRQGVYVVIVGETRTSAGKELEKYGAKVLKAAGFRIGNNNGSRPQATTAFGGVQTDFFEYHPTSTGDWPKSKAAHVTSDTGAILAQLNQGGNVYGRGNPAAIAAWRAHGVAAGYAAVIYYGFDVAEYDEAAIDAMSPGPAAELPDAPAAGDWPAELKDVVWLHTNVRDWPVTATISGAKIAGGQIQFPYDKASVWPVATSGTGKGTNANVWAIAQIAGKWYAATWEWLRKGQTSKPVGCLDGFKGDHFKVSPLDKWHPKSGERFYLMVSGHARSTGRNVKERANPVKVRWP